MTPEQRIDTLERQVKELLDWKKARMAQQITYPLDNQSITTLNDHFMSITDTVTYPGGVGSNTFTFYIGKQGGIEFEVHPVSLVKYFVDPTTNIFTTSSTLKFFNTQPVTLTTTDTAPAPLSANIGTTYYIIDSDGYSFKLSATSGGAAIDVTDSGSGVQFISYG